MEVGLIGTGLMGLPMGQRLLDSSVSLVTYNRTVEKLEPLRAAGAAIAPNVPALLGACSVVLLMLSDASAIREVLLSDAHRSALCGRTIIQMGTIAPRESRWLRDEIVAAGGEYLEAPVLGSIPEARTGTLQVMVGATPAQYEQWRSLLANFGQEPRYIGEVGSAAALKLALNQLIASLTTAFSLSLAFTQAQGVDPEVFMQVLRQSALYAPTFDKKLQRMLQRNFEHPNFPTKHLLKDTRLFLAEAQANHLGVDSLAGVQQILARACQLGFSDADYSALFAAVSPNPLVNLQSHQECDHVL